VPRTALFCQQTRPRRTNASTPRNRPNPLLVPSVDLLPLNNGPFTVPSNSSNSTTEQSAAGTFGGSTHLASAIRVKDPGDNDYAHGGVESSWYFLTESPSSGPLRLGVQFGAISLRASGGRNNELGWSSHEVYASLSAFPPALSFRYPSPSTAEGDFVAFVVGFRLRIHAPCINDYDFRLATESMASIAWVTLDSES
jgi:hypothetical protein